MGVVDNLLTEYHLTPDGWVQGTEKYFGRVQGEEVERPSNAVETWMSKIYQRSDWSPEDATAWMIWCDPFVSEEKRNAIREKFRRPFYGRIVENRE